MVTAYPWVGLGCMRGRGTAGAVRIFALLHVVRLTADLGQSRGGASGRLEMKASPAGPGGLLVAHRAATP
jgi:hypothetical protein